MMRLIDHDPVRTAPPGAHSLQARYELGEEIRAFLHRDPEQVDDDLRLRITQSLQDLVNVRRTTRLPTVTISSTVL